MTDAELIELHGGCTAVAARLGFGDGGPQRVSNWKTRGIPAAIRLRYPWLRQAAHRSDPDVQATAAKNARAAEAQPA